MTFEDYEHRCKLIPNGGVSVCRSEEFLHGDIWKWCLVVQRSAEESDLEENHYLNEVGETIWQTVVGISHCPYCGATLEPLEPEGSLLEADFLHIDLSG